MNYVVKEGNVTWLWDQLYEFFMGNNGKEVAYHDW